MNREELSIPKPWRARPMHTDYEAINSAGAVVPAWEVVGADGGVVAKALSERDARTIARALVADLDDPANCPSCGDPKNNAEPGRCAACYGGGE